MVAGLIFPVFKTKTNSSIDLIKGMIYNDFVDTFAALKKKLMKDKRESREYDE